MSKHDYPQNKSVSARIKAVGESIAYVDGILSMVLELGPDSGVRKVMLDRLQEAKDRLSVATDALLGE